jgi:hypothetical protein
MSSVLLLALMGGLLAAPGVPACVGVYGQREGSAVTRLAMMFGLGYAVTAGCAFVLSAFHVFYLATFIPLWLVITGGLWVWAVKGGSIRGFLSATAADVRAQRVVLIIGALVLLVFLAIHVRYLYVLGAPRYVYYLNGQEIANSHGVPAATLEYGQSWAPATDKIYLDAFTGLLVLFNHNTALGPGVLLLLASTGTFLGLWATAWELGLRRTGVLLPVLYIGNMVFSSAVSLGFTDYRAEDFGRAIAFCALATGIVAIRDKRWLPAFAAAAILAAASGTHLIPVVVVVLALCLAALSEIWLNHAGRDRLVPLARLAGLGAIAGVGGLIIRLLAGGTFGLQGAQNQAGYGAGGSAFDPTAYLYGGVKIATHRGLWDTEPWRVVSHMMIDSTGTPLSWLVLLLIAASILAAALTFSQESLRPAAVTGLGMVFGLIFVALLFALHYHTYIDETFGVRRLSSYVAIGYLLLLVGVLEYLTLVLDRAAPRLAVAAALTAVVGVSAWLLPTTGVNASATYIGDQRTELANWVRTSTPCNARFLINQRTEGTFTALTGRFALLEGMGAFLRTKQLPYVVSLMLKGQTFFHQPMGDEAFLRRHDISYVVVAQGFQLLGYQAPIGPANLLQLNAAPFLQLVFSTRSVSVFKVVGTGQAPVSPLLKGPYLHCIRAPISY